MNKTEQIRVRVEPDIKHRAGAILDELGLSFSDAVSLYMRQIIVRRGLPFEVNLPNAETQKAMAELERGAGEEIALSDFRSQLTKLKK